ncbi:hypothetical protein [Nocardioides sp. YIM 152588]
MDMYAHEMRARQQMADKMARATQRRIEARTRAARRRRRQAADLT